MSPIRDSLPNALKNAVGKAGWEVVQIGESGAEVYRLNDAGRAPRYLKVQVRRPDVERGLEAERDRMAWLKGRLPVPDVLAFVSDKGRDWLLMSEIPGIPACEPDHGLTREEKVHRLAVALKQVHAVASPDCPFDERVETKLAKAEHRLAAGLVRESAVGPFRPGKSPRAILDELKRSRPATAGVVVTHGDYCEPNILLTRDGLGGFIDLGFAGIADRETDFASACRSLRRNGDGPLLGLFFREYGAPSLMPAQEEYYELLDAFFWI